MSLSKIVQKFICNYCDSAIPESIINKFAPLQEENFYRNILLEDCSNRCNSFLSSCNNDFPSPCGKYYYYNVSHQEIEQ